MSAPTLVRKPPFTAWPVTEFIVRVSVNPNDPAAVAHDRILRRGSPEDLRQFLGLLDRVGSTSAGITLIVRG